ncbi:hypothetical protein Tco_0386067 [Tanacetum coccineum]
MGFSTEEQGHVHDMIKMRVKFAIKMLMHDINLQREKISEESHDFAKEHMDKMLKQKLIMEQINKKKQEHASERVKSAI